MAPAEIPIFPLPSVVLFPTVFLPLHIFEPRYRQMVKDALAGDRILGMSLLRPGWEDAYEQRPAIYQVGCAGLISHTEALDDGRYNIVLRGFSRYRVLAESSARPYRLAQVEWLPEREAEGGSAELRTERQRLEAVLAPLVEAGRAQVPGNLPDDHLVNALAQYLQFDPVERQALLELDSVLARCRALIELIEMKLLLERSPGAGGGSVH